MPHDVDAYDGPDDPALPRRKVAPIDRWLDAALRPVFMTVFRPRPAAPPVRRSARLDADAHLSDDDLALPRREIAPIDRKLDRMLRSVLLFGIAGVYGAGMWIALTAVTRPHDNGWPYTAFALAVGAASVAAAVWTGIVIRRKRHRRR